MVVGGGCAFHCQTRSRLRRSFACCQNKSAPECTRFICLQEGFVMKWPFSKETLFAFGQWLVCRFCKVNEPMDAPKEVQNSASSDKAFQFPRNSSNTLDISSCSSSLNFFSALALSLIVADMFMRILYAVMSASLLHGSLLEKAKQAF